MCFETRLWDRHTRNGAWGPSQAGYLGQQRLFSDGSGTRHPDQQEATGRRRRSASPPGNQNYSRSQDHEQRTPDLPGRVRDFSQVRKDRGKCFNGTLSRWRVCFRDRLFFFFKHIKYRTRYFRCCCCSVAKSCPTLWDPTDCSTPGFPALHDLPEFAQIHVRCVDDAIQSDHLLSPFSSCPQFFPTSGSFPVSQLFTSGGQNIRASASAPVLPMNIQG